MIFFNKYKYRLERAYELISYMILNYNDITPADKFRKQGLEQARRAIANFIDKDDMESVIKDLRKRKVLKNG